MKNRIIRRILALDGILLLVIVALYIADRVSGVSCGPWAYVTIPYLGCSGYAHVALLLLLGPLMLLMVLTLPLLVVALMLEVEAALRRLTRDWRHHQ